MADEDVFVNIKPTVRLRRIIERDLMRPNSTGPIRRSMGLWGVRYRSFTQERFDRFSKGGGDWPRHSPVTLANRRRKAGGSMTRKDPSGKVRRKKFRARGQHSDLSRKPALLRDKGLLFNATEPIFTHAPGALQKNIIGGIEVGFGGPAKHSSGGKGNSTITDIANFHQKGGGRLPQRKIIVPPPKAVVDRMAADTEKAMEEARKRAESG